MTQAFTRDLMRGSIDLMVLSVLADEPTYGYEIQKRVRAATDRRAMLAAGTLYPLLHKLEAGGAIRSRWDKTGNRKRKWYSLTAAGRRRLRHQAGQWADYARCMNNLLKPAMARVTPA